LTFTPTEAAWNIKSTESNISRKKIVGEGEEEKGRKMGMREIGRYKKEKVRRDI
jgi:hypothetical protein